MTAGSRRVSVIDTPAVQQPLQRLQGVIGQGHLALGLVLRKRHLTGQAVFLPDQPLDRLCLLDRSEVLALDVLEQRGGTGLLQLADPHLGQRRIILLN